MVAKMLLGGCLLAEVKSAQPQVSRNTSDLSVYGFLITANERYLINKYT